jgi:chromatin segregation and condensation protein Rec8/ScpA/Scc1 (kleisin family)
VDPNQLERMIEEPTWRAVLVDLIARQRIDPWDIDIDILANGFMERVKKMKENSFTVPGNVILACAILYKFKTFMIRLEETQEESVDVSFDINDVKDLVARPARKRPITINELLKAMEKAMKYEPKIEKAIASGQNERARHTLDELLDTEYVYEYEENDMSSRISSILDRIKDRKDSYGITLFSDVADKKGVIYSLLPVLFLANEGVLDVWQEELFGEIMIRYNGGAIG